MRILVLLLLLGGLQDQRARIVFLGDSITDGHTAPLLVEEALGEQSPACVNAGVAGDTSGAMRQRVDRDVLARHPTLVTLSAGINDILRNVPASEFEANVTAISNRLKQAGVSMILLTPTILGPKHAEAEQQLGCYIDVLRRLAAREGYAVAEVHARMQKARTAGLDLLEPDQVHLTFEGYRVMIRAVLDALGHPAVPVPRALTLRPMKGLIREWKLRGTPEGEWKSLNLPQTEKVEHWWLDQERQRGFAVELGKLLGPSTRFRGTASLESDRARDVFLNTGADLCSLRLNGKLIWKSEGWTGWHAGKERIAAHLAQGLNVLEIECGNAFFLSVTDDNSW